MKISITTLLLAFAVAGSQAKLFGGSNGQLFPFCVKRNTSDVDAVRAVPAYRDWTDSQLEDWLTDHKVPNPSRLNTDQMRDLVAQNYDAACVGTLYASQNLD